MKKILHRVIGYPTLDQPKILMRNSKVIIEKNTRAKWNKRGMKIDTIIDPLLEFCIRVMLYKLYESSRLNSVLCIVVDVGYKIVKKDHTYDLAELQMQQIMENLRAIRKFKSPQYKFGSILVCIFSYIRNEF